MTIIQTEHLRPDSLTPSEALQTYCGLDCCVALESFEEINRTYNRPPDIYSFARALQAPYLEIMFRGFLVDELSRQHVAKQLHDRIDHLTQQLNTLAYAFWDRPLIKFGKKLPHYTVLQEFFYDTMKLPQIWLSHKGERKLSTNREALEKLEQHLFARPFIAHILLIRDLRKQLSVFEEEIDSDGRHRTSYNIAGTETGRPSSSENAFGTGGNQQNVSPSLRYVFVADPGYKLCVIDLEQVEARDVGFFIGCLFDDWSYLDACESGDLHTTNARLIWPERKWTGNIQADRKLAEENFYREFSFRYMSKRGGHLSNYMGTAWTASRVLKVPLAIMEDFQARYCRGRTAGRHGPAIEPAYPGIPRFWQWIAEQLQLYGHLTTPFGRKRNFFGRPGDDTTVREAIAFLPQSTTADRMNLGLWRVWKHMPQVQLLAQTYDSITFQYRETNAEREGQLIAEALERIRVELIAPNGRQYVVPGEAKIGWNWGNSVTQADIAKAKADGILRLPRLNVDGLQKWSASVPDTRKRQVGLQRLMVA